MKDIFEVWECKNIFQLIDTKKDLLMHENDGLIFTIDAVPYFPGTCNEIIKWKPAHMNTIDFEIKYLGIFKTSENKIWGLHVRDGRDKTSLFGYFVFDRKNKEEFNLEERFYHDL